MTEVQEGGFFSRLFGRNKKAAAQPMQKTPTKHSIYDQLSQFGRPITKEEDEQGINITPDRVHHGVTPVEAIKRGAVVGTFPVQDKKQYNSPHQILRDKAGEESLEEYKKDLKKVD